MLAPRVISSPVLDSEALGSGGLRGIWAYFFWQPLFHLHDCLTYLECLSGRGVVQAALRGDSPPWV